MLQIPFKYRYFLIRSNPKIDQCIYKAQYIDLHSVPDFDFSTPRGIHLQIHNE